MADVIFAAVMMRWTAAFAMVMEIAPIVAEKEPSHKNPSS